VKKLSIGQSKAASEILGNIAVAWFTVGVISPIFIRPRSFFDFISNLMLGLIMTIFFSATCLNFVKDIKS